MTYNGGGAEIVAGGITYNHLSLAKSGGAASLSASATLNGNLIITNAGAFALSAPLTVGGNVAVASNANFQVSGAGTTLWVSGNWSQVGSFTPGPGTVVFTGPNAQSIGASTFNNLTFNKSSGAATLAGNLSVGGDLNLSAGTLDLAGFTIARSVVGGLFTMGASTTLKVGGGFPANFGVRSLSTGSTVAYNGASAQIVSGETYGNLVLAGANPKTLAAAALVAGDLTIQSNATFAASSYLLELAGNWTNNGTFAYGTSTIKLSGAGKAVSGNTDFNHFTVTGSYTAAGSDLAIHGDAIVSGSLDTGSGHASLDGDLTDTGPFSSSGTVTFTGTRVQNLQLLGTVLFAPSSVINFNGTVAPVLSSVPGTSFAAVNINNTAGITPDIGWTVFGAFTVANNAAFYAGSSAHTFYGAFVNNGAVTSSGTLDFEPTNSVTLRLAGVLFSSAGTVQFGGSGQISLVGNASAFNTVAIANTHTLGFAANTNWTLSGDLGVAPAQPSTPAPG